MGILRFYITTTFKEDSSETGASSCTSQKQRETPTHIACQTSKDDVRMMPSATISTVSDEVNQSSTPTKTEGQFYELFDMIEVNCSGVSPGTVTFGPFETVPGEIADQDDTLPLPVSQSDADSFGTPVASSSHQAQVLLQSVQSVQESPLSEPRQTSEPNIPIDIPIDVDAHLEIPPRIPTPPPPVVTYLHIHRVNIVEEVIAHFKNPDIVSTEIKTAFVGEKGIDNNGVSRDAYCSFWQEFFTGSAEGEECRVPAINTKWMEEEWKAIGRILLKGYKDHNFFPLQFSEAFVIALIHGEDMVTPNVLLKSFMTYLCPTDREVVKMTMESDSNPCDNEELVDFLDRMGCHSIPSKSEFMPLLYQVAHKELIQKPNYALDKMSETASDKLAQELPSVQAVFNMYKERKPTTRKVLKMLDGEVMNNAEDDSMKYLKQFVRSLDEQSLGKFLHFVTGFNTAPTKMIKVTFTGLDGLARRPIAHTCGPVLELPCTYISYPDFRKEMESILSNIVNFEMSIA